MTFEEQMISKLNKLYAKVNTLDASSTDHYRMVDTFRERLYYKDFPVNEKMTPDFKEQFLNLTRGLDQRSVETIVLALRRIAKIQSTDERYLSLYNSREAEEAKAIEEEFQQQIIELSKDCFYFDGYMLPKNSFEACVFYDRCGAKEIVHPEKLRNKDIIDAGAYIGDSALFLAEMTDRRVYAFEPTGSNFRDMLKTVELNAAENIVPVQLGLGREKGQIEMNVSLIASANTQIRTEGIPYASVEKADVVTLDDYAKEHHLDIGLIKVDVEGAEQLLLAGAMETIREKKPVLLISIYHNADDFFHIKPILEAMDLGYTFKVRHPAIGTVLTETMLIAEVLD